MWVRICPHVFETILARLKLKHLKTVRYFIAFFVVADQCDQIWRFFGLWATF